MSQIDYYFSLVGGYEKYDSDNVALEQHLTFFTRCRISVSAAIGTLIILLMDDENAFFRNLITIGLIVLLIGGNGLIFNRIAWYFLVIMFPCFGVVMRNYRANNRLKKWLTCMLLLQTVVFSYDVLTNTNARGCVPYDSVFSEDFVNQKFRLRDY